MGRSNLLKLFNLHTFYLNKYDSHYPLAVIYHLAPLRFFAFLRLNAYNINISMAVRTELCIYYQLSVLKMINAGKVLTMRLVNLTV